LGGSRIAVAHRQRDRLLQGEDIFHLRIFGQGIEKTLFNRSGVAEHVLHAIG